MAKIVRVEALMIDLVPQVKRVDAIQSFVSQETPIVRITDADGAVGTGYSYTIGTGGPSVMRADREDAGAGALIGRDATQLEKIWRDLLFLTHATTVGAITAIAQAAIDTALWDLKCRKANLPLHIMAGRRAGEGPALFHRGWLASPRAGSARRRRSAPEIEAGFGGAKLKVGRPIHEDVARIGAVREAVGPGFEIFTDANQAFRDRRGHPPRPALRAARHRLARGASPGRRHRRARPAGAFDQRAGGGRRKPLQSLCTSGITYSAAPVRSCRSMSAGSAASRPGSRSRTSRSASTSRSAHISSWSSTSPCVPRCRMPAGSSTFRSSTR